MNPISLHETDVQSERLYEALVDVMLERSVGMSVASVIGVIELMKWELIDGMG